LTILGIVIGVTAVVLLVGLGEGQRSALTTMFEDMGANAIYISSTSAKAGGNIVPLTLDDAEALDDPRRAPSVEVVAPLISKLVQVSYANADVSISCLGITPEMAEVRSYPVTEGNFISDTDVNRRSSVIVLGYQTAVDLFGVASPLGETVRVDGRRFQVIGVIEELGGRNGDDYILMPITTMQAKIVAGKTVQQIAVVAVDTDQTDAVIAQVTNILRERHHIRDGDENDFDVKDMREILNNMQQSLATFSIFLGSVGAISLVVGGIGIMNIMLVSVTERTREIGIRKAIGAKRKDILGQFLLEAAMLSLSGGFLGILLAWLGSLAIGNLSENASLMGRLPLEAQIHADIVIIALLVAIGIGLISGTYPAFRAARLDPIESLRHE
jgi:putative ABC transport system permease protein